MNSVRPSSSPRHAITPFLWFDDQAMEAARHYTSIFPNSRITGVTHYGKAGPRPEGSVMTVVFELDGQEFVALNGGPIFKFTPAVSFSVSCETQAEVDEFWERLSEDGEKQPCGWLVDRYGLSWQIVPSVLDKMLLDGDRERADAVMEAVLQMGKPDIAKLHEAYERRAR